MSLLLLLSGTQQTAGDAPADLELLYKPVRDEIARLLRNRTFGKGGQLREFTDDSDPSADQVDRLIDDAASLVAGKAGIDLPEIVHPIARRVVALRTILLIEPGARDFNPERVREFREQYKEELASLVVAAQDARDGDDPGEADDRVSPLGSFPPAPCDSGHVPGAESPYWTC